jgi:hypothetical protein
LLVRGALTGSQQKKVPKGLSVPMFRIGFMGRDDNAPKGVGSVLISDAARRIFANPDIAAWGLMLDSEGGPTNGSLWEWYKRQGFSPTRDGNNPGVMFAPLKQLIPELN